MANRTIGTGPQSPRRAACCVAAGLALISLMSGCGRRKSAADAQAPVQLKLYAPCGMVRPFKEVAKIFEQRHRVKIDARFDKPGTIAHDVAEKGHRPDVFVSPGPVEIGLVEAAGLIDASTKKPFATYGLGVMVFEENPGGVQTVDDLRKPEVKAVVLAQFSDNSVGVFAREVLQSRGVWDEVKDKLVFAGDATTGLGFLLDGRAQATITSLTCPFVTAPESVPKGPLKFVETIAKEQHSPIECVIACLNTTEHTQLSRRFVEFIVSPEIQAKLKELGMPLLDPVAGQDAP